MNRQMERLMQESRENPAKWLQYLMLTLLFGLAFILPLYGVRQQAVESAARNGNGTIVLDAGHGGFDNGMIGSSGITEKELNLIYTKKLEQLLVKAGYRVVQTRDTEKGLYDDEEQSNKKIQDMQRRCEIIEKEKPLLAVSVHQNSYPQDSSVCGPQVFYFEQSEAGEDLAKTLQKHLNAMPDVMKQRVQKGNSTYYILKHSVCPTVIVECGFLTNPEEEIRLQEETYQEQITEALYKGIMEYLNR